MAVAAACGWSVGSEDDIPTITRPNAGGAGLRPSMLQDVLAGRPMEVDALLGQTQVFAREQRVATPVLDVVLALLHGLDQAVQQPSGR
jgi:2-dehydropantoate 2-reductase